MLAVFVICGALSLSGLSFPGLSADMVIIHGPASLTA
jgi:hypothetical protein